MLRHGFFSLLIKTCSIQLEALRNLVASGRVDSDQAVLQITTGQHHLKLYLLI